MELIQIVGSDLSHNNKESEMNQYWVDTVTKNLNQLSWVLMFQTESLENKRTTFLKKVLQLLFGSFRGQSWCRYLHQAKRIEAADPRVWISGKLEETEEGYPVGLLAVSINLDPWEVLNTGPPTRQHIPADMKPLTHREQRTAQSGFSQRRHT